MRGRRVSRASRTARWAWCGEAAFEAADSLRFEGNVGYTATITTPNGSRMDSGVSFVNYGDTQIRNAGVNGFNFVETYASDQPAPGDCEDDDEDDGGDDCEDDDDDDD